MLLELQCDSKKYNLAAEYDDGTCVCYIYIKKKIMFSKCFRQGGSQYIYCKDSNWNPRYESLLKSRILTRYLTNWLKYSKCFGSIWCVSLILNNVRGIITLFFSSFRLCCLSCQHYYTSVMSYVPGVCAVLALLMLFTLGKDTFEVKEGKTSLFLSDRLIIYFHVSMVYNALNIFDARGVHDKMGWRQVEALFRFKPR